MGKYAVKKPIENPQDASQVEVLHSVRISGLCSLCKSVF